MNRSNVAGRVSRIDDDGIEWTKATSKNGVPFEIGIKKTDFKVTVKDHREDFTQATSPFFRVDWPPGDDDTWQWTAGELTRDWISHYKLRPSASDHILYITSVASRPATYVFTDEDHDSYELKVKFPSNNYFLRYRSQHPTIVGVNVLSYY